MSELDDQFRPFGEYPGYKLMAPCVRDCDHYLAFNGCDNSGCWCKKNNLDRRVSSLERCASTSCTFADMNTATDVAVLSSIQLQYCVDRGLSPDGMTMPSTALAQTTESSSSSESPLETGGSLTEVPATVPGLTSDTGSATRTRPSSGPVDTSTPASSSTSAATPNTSTSTPTNPSLSTAAKAGIALAALFCILLTVLLTILLLRRRNRNRNRNRTHPHPQPHTPPTGPPEYSPAPLSTNIHSAPAFAAAAPVREPVSPLSEKTPAFSHASAVASGGGVARKEGASSASMEVLGSSPPERYEVHGDAVRAGGFGGGVGAVQKQGQGQGGRWVYEMQGGGGGWDGAVELGGVGR
ncbi:hypothetical protein PMIN04_002395 [Paraphaeosphaeria minitans]